jgi:hypothetical protein
MLYIEFIKFKEAYMKDNTIYDVVHQALIILRTEVGLAQSSLKTVESRSFKPITDFFNGKNEAYYNEGLINELEGFYKKHLQDGIISPNVYNLRIRGTRILREVYETGTFSWKGPAGKPVPALMENFERLIAGVVNPGCSKRKNREIQHVVRCSLMSLIGLGINDIAQVKAEHI